MISGLLVLNSSYCGSRDLWWPQDPTAVVGYNVYRAFDYPTNWIKLNAVPIPGQFYRDISTLTSTTYTVQPTDWVEQGTFGRWGFRIPDIPYSDIVDTRPQISSSSDDVYVIVDGKTFRPAMVDGMQQTVWLNVDTTLPVGGEVSNFPVLNPNQSSEFKVVYNKLTNFVDIYLSGTRTYYTVAPVGSSGELHLPGVIGSEVVDTQSSERVNYIVREEIRRNAWLFERAGEPASIMFRMSRGTRCSCAQDGVEEARHGCKICYETGWVGGYYGPYDIVYCPPDTALLTTITEGGRKVDRASRSYLGPTPIIQSGDMIVRRNGERLIIHDVTYTSPQGTIAQQEFMVTLLNKKDTRYLIPVVVGNPIPTIFNPATTQDPTDGTGGSEPVFTKDYDQTFENKDKQPGRTVIWGKIQG